MRSCENNKWYKKKNVATCEKDIVCLFVENGHVPWINAAAKRMCPKPFVCVALKIQWLST